jgi:hypothetical protein
MDPDRETTEPEREMPLVIDVDRVRFDQTPGVSAFDGARLRVVIEPGSVGVSKLEISPDDSGDGKNIKPGGSRRLGGSRYEIGGPRALDDDCLAGTFVLV